MAKENRQEVGFKRPGNGCLNLPGLASLALVQTTKGRHTTAQATLSHLYSQAPVIRIVYNFDQFVEPGMDRSNSFSSNEFKDNYNF